MMNGKAKSIGLKKTHYITPHGLDDERHYTTALELAKITDYALRIEKFSKVVNTRTYTVRINKKNKTIRNTNELLGYLNGVNGVKTGFTNKAGRCLVTSVNRNGFNIITVVLGADSKKLRTKDSISIIEYTYSNYRLVNLEEMVTSKYEEWKRINKNRIDIFKAKDNSFNIKLEDYNNKIYPVKTDEIKNINIEIKNIKTQFEAPVNKGEEIASVILRIKDKEIINTRIVIDNYIENKDCLFYFIFLLKSFV